MHNFRTPLPPPAPSFPSSLSSLLCANAPTGYCKRRLSLTAIGLLPWNVLTSRERWEINHSSRNCRNRPQRLQKQPSVPPDHHPSAHRRIFLPSIIVTKWRILLSLGRPLPRSRCLRRCPRRRHRPRRQIHSHHPLTPLAPPRLSSSWERVSTS